MAEASAHRRLEDVLDRLVRPPRRRQALVAGALLRGSELVRGVPGGPEEPLDDASVFEIGSITKVFTGILLAAGADRGLVELDDPLRALLPSSARLPAEGPEITLPSSPRTPPGCRECRRACRRSCSASGAGSVPGAPRPTSSSPRSRAPGSGMRPAGGTGTRISARRSWAMRSPGGRRRAGRSSCRRSSASRSGCSGRAPPSRPQSGHGLRGSLLGRAAPPWEFPALAPAGALRSTARDMVSFLRANLDEPPGDVARPLTLARAPRFDSGGRLQVGLGWHILPLHGSPLPGARSRVRDSPVMVWHTA